MTLSNSAVRLLLSGIGIVALSACASLPPPKADPYDGKVPASFAAGPPVPAGIDENWWQRFRNPRLDALIAEAVGENTQITQAQARAAQARARAVIEGADRLPQLSAGTDASKSYRGSGLNPTGRSNETDSFGLNLNARWEIDLWGRIAAQSEAAREDYLASAETLRAIRQSVAAQTAKAYFATVEAGQQADLSRRILEVRTETARQVGNRADAGVAAPNDKHLAFANRESAAAGLAGSEETRERTGRRLEVLVRDYPDGTVDVASVLSAVPPSPPAGLPAELLRRRPDVLAAERRLRSAGLRTFAAEKSLLPAISLTGNIGTSSAELRDLLDANYLLWTLAGNLVQPIFQGGRLRANVALNEAAEREAAEAYAETVLQAFSEVETALAADTRIREREAALCQAASAAEEAERVSTNRYQQGVDPFLTVLESQQRVLDTRSACIAARRAILDNRIDLHLALGGGFDRPVEPVVATTILNAY